MSDQVRFVLRQLLGGAALFVAMMVFGLVTRPLAGALPAFYGFHAVLVALPSAFAITFCLRKGLRPLTALIAVALFALMLLAMSPVMGMAAVLPLIGAALAFVVANRGASERGPWAAGAAYGLLFYPCTVGASLALGSLSATYMAESWLIVLVSLLLGAALSLVGATLASGKLTDKRP